MERYDIIIIGTGPAGLSAAITAKVRNKKILLLGEKTLSDKVGKAHTIQNYLGLPEISGEALQKAFLEHLDKLSITITEDRVKAVYVLGSYFAVQGRTEIYEATSVIFAAGLSVAKPYPGELENLGRGVSYCATCDAALYRGKTAIVLAFSKEDESEADFLAEIADQVFYLQMYEGDVSLRKNIQVIKHVNPISIETKEGKIELMTTQQNLSADGIFILREQVPPAQLIPGMKMDGNHVEVDRKMKTNIDGLFACGDITGAPYQYSKAVGEGNVAALSAVSYLVEQNKRV